jgi:hypothetical protein
MTQPLITPLIERHYSELSFNLFLQHRGTGKYVGTSGLVDRPNAIMVRCGPAGASVRNLYLTIAEDLGANWLLMRHAPQDFDLVSELGHPVRGLRGILNGDEKRAGETQPVLKLGRPVHGFRGTPNGDEKRAAETQPVAV